MRVYHLNMSGSSQCEHQQYRVELTPNLKHYGKRICLACGKFMGWEPDPKTTSETSERDSIIDRLLNQRLTEWERGFLSSIKGKRHLSERQIECFEKIRGKNGY